MPFPRASSPVATPGWTPRSRSRSMPRATFTSPTSTSPSPASRCMPRARIAGGSTGLVAPAGIALDAAGNIYVPNANASPADVTIYAAAADGDVAPTSTIITRFVAGIPDLSFVFGFPIGIALDGSGNVHVASFGNHSIVVYAAGTSGVGTPLTVIAGGNTGLAALCGLAF